jgi:uncharacterized protein YjbI with pentapeptide repeats
LQEEARLREEARRVEAERLAEQARRNIELRQQMEMQEEAERVRRQQRQPMSEESFDRLLEQHLRWQNTYEIDENTDIKKLPEHVLKDPRRLILNAVDIKDITIDEDEFVFGAKFIDCEFESCEISTHLIASVLEQCSFMNSKLCDIQLDQCSLTGVDVERVTIENVRLDESTIIQSNLKAAMISNLVAAPATSFIKCDFTNARLTECDMKKNVFANCDFYNAKFVSCDMRDSAFQVCKMEAVEKEGSLFKGAKFD